MRNSSSSMEMLRFKTTILSLKNNQKFTIWKNENCRQFASVAESRLWKKVYIFEKTPGKVYDAINTYET